jgi:hypothetical protein
MSHIPTVNLPSEARMVTKSRIAAAVVTGAVLWAILWVGGAAIAQRIWPELIIPGQRLDHTGALLGYVAYSIIVSVISGYVTARIAAGTRAVATLAAIQLALGIAIEGASWQLTPAWYHIVFLALLVPAILWGGSLARRTAPSAAAFATR